MIILGHDEPGLCVRGRAEEPPSDGEPPWELLDRYFSGGCSTAEAARIARWANAAPERASELAALRAMCAAGSRNPAGTPTWDTERSRRRAHRIYARRPPKRSLRELTAFEWAHRANRRRGRARVMARVGYPSPEREFSGQAWVSSAGCTRLLARSRHRCCRGERILMIRRRTPDAHAAGRSRIRHTGGRAGHGLTARWHGANPRPRHSYPRTPRLRPRDSDSRTRWGRTLFRGP